MAMTLGEKIIARASGRERVSPGEIVTCQVDLAMMHDSSGPRRQDDKLEELGARLWDPDKVVVVTDHFVTETDPESIAIQQLTREWVAAQGVSNFHEAQGICHIILPERGHLRPGMFAVGGDSHSPTAGAYGCFMVGVGATELAGVLATGEIWVRVPTTLKVKVSGQLSRKVAAKDVILWLCAKIGIMGANYKVVEYTGEAITAMSMDERMVLTNMSAELGAKTGIIAPDETTRSSLRRAGVETESLRPWQSDTDATFEQVIEIDGTTLMPQVAAPHSPENSASVSEHEDTRVDQVFIGACTGAKLDDLKMAAELVKGHATAVPLFVAPSTQRIAEEAQRQGILQTLEDAGATILPSACSACIGLGPAALGDNKVGVSTSSRNFRGRMGAKSSQTYLASAYTAAATALRGVITDPRSIDSEKAP